ncbi:restriction endonuclease subunit S [Alishewanella sp. HL-SH06]|uniref:restriction endonuclease subunit S n=1 Tax=Alishewanella sp. HL-SH06 TaxID=3461144 RepID=UPI004042D3E6
MSGVTEVSAKFVPDSRENDLPNGYKHTLLGLIPIEWNCESLGDLCSLKSGLGITSKSINETGEYPCYGGNGLRGYTSQFTHEGDYALIGRQGALCGNIQYLTGKFFASEHALVASPFDRVDPKWLAIYLESMNLNQYSESSAQPGLSAEKLRVLNLITPTFAEQTAIANALSDVDTLIQELEKLIAKKQAIKTATMQQLLTGRTRLPQFAHHPDGRKKGYKPSELGEIPEDWEVSVLASMVSTLNAGVSVNSIDRIDAFTHGKHILKTSCVTSGYFDESEIKSILPIDLNRAKCSPEAGCIIVSRMNTPALVGEIGYVSQDYPEMFLPDRLWQMKFKADSSLNSRWLAYVLSYPSTAKKIKEAATGTSDSMKNISKEGLLALRILNPSFNEQTAIATILSDMDEEIQALDQRLNKTRQIKQGMMQELLTGKTRLVKPASAA